MKYYYRKENFFNFPLRLLLLTVCKIYGTRDQKWAPVSSKHLIEDLKGIESWLTGSQIIHKYFENGVFI